MSQKFQPPTMITPDMAKEILAKNTKNRRVNKNIVKRYARDMVEGRWKFNGASVLISDEGELIDGQHRLLACIRSGVTFPAYIVRGLEENVRVTVDSGRKRSAGDAIQLGGLAESYAPGIAASSRLVLNYLNGVHVWEIPSTAEIFDLTSQQPEIAETHILAKPAGKIMQVSILGAVLFLGTRERDNDRWATEFVDAIVSGANLREDDPRLVLRNLFLNARMRSQGNNALPRAPWAFPAIAMGWNAWVQQEPTKMIRPTSTRLGNFKVPDVIGGPAFGSGVDALRAGKISKQRIREVQQEEAASRNELLSR